MPFREFDFIRQLRDSAPRAKHIAVPLGDDCAALDLAGRGELCVTTDIRLDGVHFITGQHTPEQIGHKALACSLSDLAAMASVPVGAVVAVALPRSALADGDPFPQRLLAGMRPLADRHGCPIVGGDTTVWNGPLALCVTCLGVADGLAPVTRTGAQPGDAIWVTGRLGGSILGRHLAFEPRVAEARRLARSTRPTAMIDVSDGLSSDLLHLCGQDVSALLEETALLACAHADAHARSQRGGTAVIDHVLHDGEDFELLFTLPPGLMPDLGPLPATRVGQMRRREDAQAPPLSLRRLDGASEDIPIRGYEHASP